MVSCRGRECIAFGIFVSRWPRHTDMAFEVRSRRGLAKGQMKEMCRAAARAREGAAPLSSAIQVPRSLFTSGGSWYFGEFPEYILPACVRQPSGL